MFKQHQIEMTASRANTAPVRLRVGDIVELIAPSNAYRSPTASVASRVCSFVSDDLARTIIQATAPGLVTISRTAAAGEAGDTPALVTITIEIR